MDLQERDLSIDMQGEDVQFLHSELHSLGYEIPHEEIARSFFGPATHDAVLDFQRKHALEPNGIVDECTAHAINAAVDAQRPIPEQFVVSGQVRHQDETPLEGLIVRAFDIDRRGEAQLGEETTTDGRGGYEITYLAESLSQREKRRADLMVRVYSPAETLLVESEVRSSAADHETVDLIVVPQIDPSPEEELEAHEIVFRLLNQETEEPLGGYTVLAFDLDGGEEPVELGFDMTNARGLFTVIYTTSPEEVAERRRLRLQVINSEGEEIHQTEIEVAPDQAEVIDIGIPLPEVQEPPSPVIEELNETLQMELPQELLARLEEENIRTVDDVRKTGGICELENLPVATDHPAVRTIEAHANLSVMSSDTELNEALIENGFDSIITIANTPQNDFVGAMPEQIGREKALQIHGKASNQDLFLCNMETMLRTDQANRFEWPLGVDPSKLSASRCECADCESAVSPLAYLAELLKYVVKNLRVNDNNKITLNDLELQFHQPFDALPASCEEMDNKVRQVRLCIEVLRRYLKVNNLPAAGSNDEKKLQKTEQEYLVAAYESVLTQLGTSYEEIRLAHNADDKTREALAAKLGIGLDANRPDQLDQLLLNTNPLAEKTKLEKLTENNLEILFGLVSTDISNSPRNPLSDGPSLGDKKDPQITRWNLKGVEWNRNTDVDGFIYIKLTSLAAGGFKVELYRDKARTLLVASGQGSTFKGTVEIRSENFSGLSGQIEIAHVADSNKIQLSAIPEVLSWRLGHLRSVWKKKDWPKKVPDDTRPLIDPDLMGLADLRTELDTNPAYDLWKKRSKWLKDLFADLKETALKANNPEKGFEDIVKEVLGGESMATLTSLLIEDKKGISIKSKLKEHNLTYAAFKHLVSFLDIAKQPNAQILDSEWDEVCNILVEIKKRRLFFDKKLERYWRKEEKDKNIVLGPDFFKPRNTALTIYPPPKSASLPAWRATRTERLNWEDALESRIDQEDALVDAFEDVADKVEVAVLEDLRDALILATGTANEDLETQAKWVTDYLLIDAKADACQKTTRISQAIETLQNLLWSLRTGQLVEYKHLDFASGVKEYFDQEWKWIGSYTSWRAAMLVFLYPENILIPTLRKEQTPAFRKLVKNLRKNRRLNPEQACQEAKEYSDYFRDICNLKVEASCHAMTDIHVGYCREKKRVDKRTLLYTFAKGTNTNNLYWSTYDQTEEDQSYAQTFWDVVPGLKNITKLVGVHPVEFLGNEHYIYVFACVYDDGKQEIVFNRYNLQTQNWEKKEYSKMELPDGVVDFDAVLCQRLDLERPRVAIHDKKRGEVQLLRLDQEGSDWEEEEIFRGFYADQVLTTNINRVLAVHELTNNITILIAESKYGQFWKKNGRLLATVIRKHPQQSWKWQEIGKLQDKPKEWIGSFQWEQTDTVYVYWKVGTQSFYARIDSAEYITEYSKFINSLVYIARDSGSVPSFPIAVAEQLIAPLPERMIASRWSKNNELEISRATVVKNKTGHLDIKSDSLIAMAPRVSGPFNIVERLTSKDLQVRRKSIAQIFNNNANEPSSNLSYVEEAYYFIPMQLALQLQKRGHYIAALDWFRTLYDYTIPDKNQDKNRKIYYRLTQEETLKQIFQRRPDWMRDPLNPHLIASTRLNAYTRFTLLSIVRCLLAYADAEFTRDTNETLTRARTLYRTALELLETKALKQDKNSCEKKIGELIIDIEDAVPDSLITTWTVIKLSLQQVKTPEAVENLAVEIKKIFARNDTWKNRLEQIQGQIDTVISQQPYPKSLGEVQTIDVIDLSRSHQLLLSDDDIAFEAREIGTYYGEKRQEAASTIRIQ